MGVQSRVITVIEGSELGEITKENCVIGHQETFTVSLRLLPSHPLRF